MKTDKDKINSDNVDIFWWMRDMGPWKWPWTKDPCRCDHCEDGKRGLW